MDIVTWTELEQLPSSRDLVMNEVAFRIGCEGCKASCSVTARISGDKETRCDLEENLRAASEITGVPVTVVSSGHKNIFGLQSEACNGERPCLEQEVNSLITGFVDTVRYAFR